MKKKLKGEVREFSSKREVKNGAYYKDGTLFVDGEAVCKKDEMVIKRYA